MSTVTLTTRAFAPALAQAEYAALLAALRALPARAWSAPTDCTGWAVREVVAHVAGAAEESARFPVMARHYGYAMLRERHRPLVDSVNDRQLADRRGRSAEQLIDEVEALAPRAVLARQRLPSLVRRVPLPQSAGALPGDTLGYLNDVVYTRDIWMHRIDIARATGTAMPASTAEPEVVAQIVRDLSRAWTGVPIDLTLTGRVTRTWRLGSSAGAAGGAVTADAVELCRTLSGRSGEGPVTVTSGDSGLADRMSAMRILF